MERGKGPAHRLRAAGRIPAVLYGGGQDAVTLSLDPSLLLKALDPALKSNTLFELHVENDPAVNCTAMIKDAQIDPLREELLHVDLIRVTAEQAIEVSVPVELVGRAVGVKAGGILQQVWREVPVLAPAGNIPAKIEVDVTDWELYHQFRARDLPLPEGVEVMLEEKIKIASIVTPRAVEEEAVTEEEGEEEGEAAAEGAEGTEGAETASE
jgi:large subunit ribosomal protein L25